MLVSYRRIEFMFLNLNTSPVLNFTKVNIF